MATQGFRDKLFVALMRDVQAFQPASGTEFPPVPQSRTEALKRRMKDSLGHVMSRAGFARRYVPAEEAAEALGRIVAMLDRLERVHDALGDDRSRDVLVQVLCHRILGSRHVALPPAGKAVWRDFQAERERIDSVALLERGTLQTAYAELSRYGLDGRSGRLELHADPLNLVLTFGVEQWAYRHPPHEVSVEPGDVTVEGGGCWGDTTLYFADRAAPDGRVASFEFVPENLAVLRPNLDLNPALAARTKLVERALWSASGERMRFASAGPFTSLVDTAAPPDAEALTGTVDDLVRGESLERLDFLKLDIEGAELEALRGAGSSLRRFRPKLAIALYHRDEDLAAIPEHLMSLELGYKLFIDHFTTQRPETILFARPRPGT